MVYELEGMGARCISKYLIWCTDGGEANGWTEGTRSLISLRSARK